MIDSPRDDDAYHNSILEHGIITLMKKMDHPILDAIREFSLA